MRVTLDDGSQIMLERPVIRLDQTITSQFGGPSVPLLDISSVEARQFDTLKTFGLVLVKVSALLHIVAAIVDSQPHYRGLF